MDHSFYAVYGASGCGRGVMPLARMQLAQAGVSIDKLVFIDDHPATPEVNGHQVLGFTSFLNQSAGQGLVTLAISDSVLREQVAHRCITNGLNPWTIKADNVVMLDDVEIGEGAILCPFVTLTVNIRIGVHFHANLYSYVEHDSVIGDYVTFAPGVKCNGNVLIEDHVYIGAGAAIKQGRPGKPLVIGKGAVIGMGAVVTKDVAPGSVVVGNPAKPLMRR